MGSHVAPLLEEYPNYATAELSFRPRIVCSRGPNHPPIKYTARVAERLVLAEWGTTTLCESLKPSTVVKPFFDYDKYLPANPGDAEIKRVVDKAKNALKNALDLENDELIAVATSHGAIVHEGQAGYKLSMHFYVQGYACKATELVGFLEHHEELADFDNKVYPKTGERLMRVVGAIKANGDNRVLEPVDASRPYSHYLIQSLIGNELRLVAGGPVPKRARLEATDAQVRPRWLKLSENDMELTALQLMRAAGMTTGYRLDYTKLNLVYLKNTGMRECVHGFTHESNNACVVFQRDGNVAYRCHGSECATKDYRLGSWRTTLADMVGDDAITPEQMKVFDPSVTRAWEEATVTSGKKLEESPDYPVFRKHALAYFDRFFKHVHIGRPEVVQARASFARTRPKITPPHIPSNAPMNPGAYHLSHGGWAGQVHP